MLRNPDILFMPPVPEGTRLPARAIPWQRWGECGGMAFTRNALESRDHLVLADNLALLDYLPTGCIDLVYIDPPFATGKRRESPHGADGPRGYEDQWDDPSDFVNWLEPRLSGLWSALSGHGNLVIHLDPRAVHHVRIWCDSHFGSDHFENEIIWHYTGGGRSRKRFSKKHDVLLWYSKGPERVFNIDAIREPYEPTSGYAKGGIISKKGKKYMPHPDGKPVDDVWDIPIVNPMSSERTAYPTQKPLRLLERIISALSNETSVVCDIFSGSGTTGVACRSLNRKFICCDSNPDALGVMLERLEKSSPGRRNPSVISHGLYCIRHVHEGDAHRIAERFVRDVAGEGHQNRFRTVMPSWRKSGNPPYPLAKTDCVINL